MVFLTPDSLDAVWLRHAGFWEDVKVRTCGLF